MSAPDLTRTALAIGFAALMLGLGALNPNGGLGEMTCGLVCESETSSTRR